MKVASNPLAENFLLKSTGSTSLLLNMTIKHFLYSVILENQGMESYFCSISRLHTVLAEPVDVFKTAEKHVGIKFALFNKITKLTNYK